jgi:hypothetical protein
MLAAIRLVAAISLVRGDERQHRMDKKNDDSCKHRQRHSFVDGRTANHCNAFHSFPHPDGMRVPDVLLSRCTASVNEALSRVVGWSYSRHKECEGFPE